MAVFRGIGESRWAGTEAGAQAAGVHEYAQRPAWSGLLAAGTLACARCDAPVALGTAPVSLTDRLTCPFCLHHGPARDFLSLASPTRPARVVVRVGLPATAR